MGFWIKVQFLIEMDKVEVGFWIKVGCAHEGGVASSDTPAQFAQSFLSKHQLNASTVCVNNLMLSHSGKTRGDSGQSCNANLKQETFETFEAR